MDSLDVSPKQRIEERRNRIKKNIMAAQRQSSVNGIIDGAIATPSFASPCAGGLKAVETVQVMNETRDDIIQAITEFQVKPASDAAERRGHEKTRMDLLKQSLTDEAEKSEIKMNAIDIHFESLRSHTVPHELRDALVVQERQCAELLVKKDAIIEELRKHLEEKEEQYVELLQKNKMDIEALVQTMRQKTEEFLNTYTLQLEAVSKTYEQERSELMHNHEDAVEQLIMTRRTRLTDYRKRRKAYFLEMQAKLEGKFEESYEDYNQTKKSHLTEVCALDEELEKCKADFLLNGERLNYNLQILRERLKENKSAQNQYKRKLARLQDTLSSLIARHRESESRYQRTNKTLTAQLHSVSAKYKDIQHKFQFFEKSDKRKYKHLWKMHDQECQQLVHRCLQVDRVLFEDILNVPWSPPDLNFWPEEQEDLEGPDTDADESAVEQAVELDEPARMLFHILRSQASILVDDNVHRAIEQIKGTTAEQADVESILFTLKLNTTEEVRDMLEYFVVDNDDNKNGSLMLIHPQEAIRALNMYLENRNKKVALQRKEQSSSPSVDQFSTSAKKGPAAEKTMREKRLADESNYWKKLVECVPEEHLQVWEAAEKGLAQYLAQVQQRKALIIETDTLRVRNEELKGLLREYMHSSINYELYVPPQLTMQGQSVLI